MIIITIIIIVKIIIIIVIIRCLTNTSEALNQNGRISDVFCWCEKSTACSFVFKLVVLSRKRSLKAMPLIEAIFRMCSSKKVICKYTKTTGIKPCRRVILIDNFNEITLQLNNCIEITPLQRRYMYLYRTYILMNTYRELLMSYN